MLVSAVELGRLRGEVRVPRWNSGAVVELERRCGGSAGAAVEFGRGGGTLPAAVDNATPALRGSPTRRQHPGGPSNLRQRCCDACRRQGRWLPPGDSPRSRRILSSRCNGLCPCAATHSIRSRETAIGAVSRRRWAPVAAVRLDLCRGRAFAPPRGRLEALCRIPARFPRGSWAGSTASGGVRTSGRPRSPSRLVEGPSLPSVRATRSLTSINAPDAPATGAQVGPRGAACVGARTRFLRGTMSL